MADLGIRYATALFELSSESGLLSDYLAQAGFFAQVVEG
jgi:F0F1-type ATP synthase delta subunit